MLKKIIAPTLCLLVVLTGCTLAARPKLPTDNLLTPAVLPTLQADGETSPLQPPDAAKGAAIYDQKCAACHGAEGKGNGPRAEQIKAQGKLVANLIDDARRRAAKPSDWHNVIANGRIQNLMPGFSGSLDAQQIWDVEAYVWSLGVVSQTVSAGQLLFGAKCASCHGAGGETPVGAATPPAAGGKLAFNDPRYLADHTLLDVANGVTRGDVHSKLVLADADRFAVAEAVRALGYRYADPAQVRLARISGNGVVRLQAANGTPGGAIPINAPVTLRIFDSTSEVLSRTVPLDTAGLVTFANLPTNADYFLQAEVEYGGGKFYAAPMQFSITGTNVLSDILPVYETLTDSAKISISDMHLFVQSINEGTATIVEFYQFGNASDRAFVGDPKSRHTLKLSLPKDAQNLRFDGLGLGKRFFRDGDGDVVWDTDVVVPGPNAQRVTLIYDVPYRNGRAFERSVFYPVAKWDVIVPEVTGPGTPLAVKGLTDKGKQQMTDGTNVLLFVGGTSPTGGNATQGDSALKFELTGQPLGAVQPGNDGRAIGFGLIALGIAAGLAYVVLRRVRDIRAAFAAGPAQADALLRQIAVLDDDFAAGKLKERNYRRRRERLKAEVLDAWEV